MFGPIGLTLTLRNKNDKKAIIHNIGVHKQDGPVVDGTAIFIESGANNEPKMAFHLDAAFPTARIVGSQGREGGAYFDTQNIPLNDQLSGIQLGDEDGRRYGCASEAVSDGVLC